MSVLQTLGVCVRVRVRVRVSGDIATVVIPLREEERRVKYGTKLQME